MQQTFNDLYHERRTQTKLGLLCFVLFIFSETAAGIMKEHVLSKTGGSKVRAFATDLRSAALISFILVLPFAILESVNNTVTRQNAPGLIALFGFLWLLPTALLITLMPVVRYVRVGNSIMAANPFTLVLRIASVVVLAFVWGSLLMDQMPCFMGVPNCD